MQEDVYQGDGLNLYVYCRNNPVIYFDPSGYYDEWLFEDRITYGDIGDSTILKIDTLQKMTNDPTIKSAAVGSHQMQHLIPGSKTTHPVIAISGYLTNNYDNGIFDKNYSVSYDSLAVYLQGRNVSPENMDRYISDKTHHGASYDPVTDKMANFNHEAYNEYIDYRLNKVALEMGIPLQFNSNKPQDMIIELQKIKDNMGEERVILLRNKVQELEEYFRIKNKEGIDLYLNNSNNRTVKNYYTDDGKVKTMTKKERWSITLKRILKNHNQIQCLLDMIHWLNFFANTVIVGILTKIWEIWYQIF